MTTLLSRPTGTLVSMITFAALASHSLGQADAASGTDMGEAVELRPFVVTAPQAKNALEVVLDAKVAYQPLPAQDGADFLKSVPGFSVVRKGGSDGDPTLRGMAGSRLGISIDGQNVLGGCSHRMDPPTAYVFPSAYDRVTILKGPQSVLFGPGVSAGVVRFESDLRRLDRRTASVESTVTAGSFGRLDAAVDGTVGNPDVYARVALTRAESGDYEDGAGNAVHSSHLRWSANVSLGWTPADDTVLQYTAIRSDGEAAYADRLMDGVEFARESHQLRFSSEKEAGLIKRTELEFGYNHIDHAMDNYSLREFVPSMMMPNPAVSNPERRTLGGRLRLDLSPQDAFELSVGADYQENRHSLRSSMNQVAMPYQNKERVSDAEFSQYGLFAEGGYEVTENGKFFAGLRVDDWRARDLREAVSVGMMTLANPTQGARRHETLLGGFVRYEGTLPDVEASYFAGVGHVERFLDYWELVANEATGSVSGFFGEPEKTTQLDFGATKQLGEASFTLAGFFSDIDDFALVENGYTKASGMGMGTRSAVVTRGVSARTWGGEAMVSWRWNERWLFDASAAYTRGENRTDGLPLAQIAPLESRLSVNYTRRDWSLGGVLRAVAKQERIAIGQGSIVGQDFGTTPGFAVFSLNGSRHLWDGGRLSAGVDNVFNTEYAEHISRAGGVVSGYAQTTRVNEPRRAFWARLDVSF